ncbi:MAG: hypothetical protein KA368_07865 [Acidobacteria bacterium]|nr:hypothetical protein [Acidobacteriota bacterium]
MNTLSQKRPTLSLICLAVLLGNLFLQPIIAFAGATQPTAQLSFAKQVSVNGKEASAGQTLFNGDRIRVSGLGSAVINIGKLGRIEIGKDTEFILYISDNLIGGDLINGCMGIIASTGVNTSVKSNKGVVSSDGGQPDSYFLGQRGNQGRVIPSLGEAKILIDGKIETVSPGETLDIDSPNGQNNLYRRNGSTCTQGMSCACGLLDPNSTRASNQQSNTNPNTPKNTPQGNSGNGGITLPLLFTAVLGAGMASFFANNPGGPAVQGNGLTCVDTTGFFCRRVSPTTPQR